MSGSSKAFIRNLATDPRMAAAAETTLADLAGSGSDHSRKLRSLTAELSELLRQQAEVSREANRLLTDPDSGMVESSRRVTKSLDAAIARSRQPGYFRYAQPPPAVQEAERKRVLSRKAEAIAALQARIDAKQAEIDAVRAEAARPPPVPDVPNLKRWFDRYERPDPAFGGEGARTTVTPNGRIYGGTAHYKAFRSVATDLRVGRLLR